ncbi:hypothetical protein [Amycolatopsis sp. NPDC102389]
MPQVFQRTRRHFGLSVVGERRRRGAEHGAARLPERVLIVRSPPTTS